MDPRSVKCVWGRDLEYEFDCMLRTDRCSLPALSSGRVCVQVLGWRPVKNRE